MSVNLIAYTQPVPRLMEEGIDDLREFVAYVARVSNPSNQMNTETSAKLVNYLIRNNHWSPLEMAHVVMEINTTRDIARQILRHRSFTFQEFSQRYADPNELGYLLREARLQDKKNRQNSIETDNLKLSVEWESRQRDVLSKALDAYQFAINEGIAKEQARAVLPEGIIKSRLYMAGSLRSWLHYVQLRSANGTQKEHQAIAQECGELLKTLF